MIGKLLKGRYEVLEELGVGGMGIVYLAYCSYLRRHVAIKVLLQSNEGKEITLLQEAKAAARLSHGNIVQIYDIFEEGNKTFIVMEYVRGKSLKQLISAQEGTPFTEQRALQLGMKLASALNHAHLNGVIHRDIKPDNIIIDQDGEPKITDFGIARVSNDTTIVHTDEILGSLRYSSPEQLRGAIIDERADIFSLGIVLFEMLTGTMPFPDDSPVTAAFKKLKEDLPSVISINPEVSIQTDAIIAKASDRDPKKRYANMNEFYYALAGALDSPKTYYKDTVVLPNNQVNPKVSPQIEYRRDETPTSSGGGKFFPILLGLLLSFVTVVLIGIPLLSGGEPLTEIEVPNFEGQSISEIQSVLDEHKLLGIVNEARESAEAKGTILSQSLSAGEKVKPGTKIYFAVSKGQDLVEVPNVLNRSVDEARNLINQAHLEMDDIKHQHHDTVPKDHVISQSIEAGQSVERLTKITLTVSQGPEKKMVKVPKLTDMEMSMSIERAQAAGLTVGIEKVESDAEVDWVLAQSIVEGTEVEPERKVILTVSSGRPVVEQPTTTNYTFVVDPSTFSAGVEGSQIEEYYLRVVLIENGEERELFIEQHSVEEGIVSTTYEAPIGAEYNMYVDALGQAFHVGAGVIQ